MFSNIFQRIGATGVCSLDEGHSLISLNAAPPLLLYSYLPVVLVALVLGFLIFRQNKKDATAKAFFLFAVLFSVWVVNILLQWIAVPNSILLFAWKMTAVFELAFYLSAFGLLYSFVKHESITKSTRQLFAALLFLVIFLTPTILNIKAYDYEECIGIIGPLWYIIYTFEVLMSILILTFGIKSALDSSFKSRRKEIIIFTLSLFIGITLFTGSNLGGELMQVYSFNLFGPVGIVVFMGFVTYLIIKYKTFDLKIFLTEIFIVSLWLLIGSLLLINNLDLLHFITFITLGGVVFVGRSLINSVRREIEQKERLERLTFQLSDANEKLKDLDKSKTEFLSLASHQLRSPLTAIKGYSSMLLDGSYDTITEKNKMPIDRIFQSANNLTLIVEDLLSVTKIEQGGMQYEFTGIDLAKIAKTLVDEQSINAKNRGLELVFENKIGTAIVRADATKIRQVLLNFVDNAIKYTPKGSVKVTVEAIDGNKVRFAVKDSGVGMSEETKHNLFEKFKRGEEGSRINSGGSGLGLYLAKEIVGAHAGEIHVESDGAGKGSTFIVDLPLKNRESKAE